MSSIQQVNNINVTMHKTLITTSNTGYIALGGIGLATASAITKNKTIKKHHKQLGYFVGILALVHLGTAIHSKIEYYKNQIK